MRPVVPVPEHIRALQPYQPGQSIEQIAAHYQTNPAAIIKLASNENPLGPSPRALLAAQSALSGIHRYPEQFELSQALARHLGVPSAHIVLGNGSNDILDLIARTFLVPGTSAISSQYAFIIYQIATQTVGSTNVIIPAQDFGHDLAAMHSAITPQTRIIWIANPNNPTGTYMPQDQLRAFLDQVPSRIIVVLDEAYYEYLDPDTRPHTPRWLTHYPNLVIVRTFSKIYGLAGLRLGYAVCHPDLAQAMQRVRQPFNVSVPALAAGVAALADQAHVRRSYQHNLDQRQILLKALITLGLTSLPSYGNFITIQVPHAHHLHEQLLQRGIIVRPLVPYGLPDHLRITIGRPAENATLLNALRDLILPNRTHLSTD